MGLDLYKAGTNNHHFAIASDKLGIALNTPTAGRLQHNLTMREPRIPDIDRLALYKQHATSAFRLAASYKFLEAIKTSTACFHFTEPNEKEERTMQITNPIEFLNFQISFESFFTFAWGTITSTVRELYMVYQLKLPREEINYYNVMKRFNKDHPKAKITAYLNDVNNAEWHRYLNRARNKVQHGEVPLYHFHYDGYVALPDDPYQTPETITTKNKYDINIWCSKILEETSKFVESCSFEMNSLLYE